MIRYLSICSGIESASVAWHHMGWQPMGFAEIDKFPAAVLSHHYPHVPNHGDFTTIQEDFYNESINLIVGGTPCQSFSTAGQRGGFDDERGNLSIQFGRLLQRIRPDWFVWENVPGVLSANGGCDFARILSEYSGQEIKPQRFASGGIIQGTPTGYSIAYRILDAQHFGVPQRRRRLFVIGYIGTDWRPPASVLFESPCMSGHIKSVGQTGKDPAPTFERNPDIESKRKYLNYLIYQVIQDIDWASYSGCDVAELTDSELSIWIENAETYITENDINPVPITTYNELNNGYFKPQQVASTLRASAGYFANGSDTIIAAYEHHPNDSRVKPITDDTSPTVVRRWGDGGNNVGCLVTHAHSIQGNIINRAVHNGGNGIVITPEKSGTLTAMDIHGVAYATDNIPIVRSLTPVECERLQGFPDNYTRIPWRDKPPEQCPNSHRYKAIGNSMAVPVMKWIGERIDFVNKEIKK